jgi:hypothetical protein
MPTWKLILSWVHVGLYLGMYIIQLIWLSIMIKGVLGDNASETKKEEKDEKKIQ